jgi:hypothetical protein
MKSSEYSKRKAEKAKSERVTAALAKVIGGITVILTAAARIPAALAEFLRAWILVATAARELRAALSRRVPEDDASEWLRLPPRSGQCVGYTNRASSPRGQTWLPCVCAGVREGR